MHDLNKDQENFFGINNAPITCVEYCPEVNAIVTRSWDPRTPCNRETFSQSEKVSMPSVWKQIKCGDRGSENVSQSREESSLKYQICCIWAFPNKLGYVLSSIEVGVAVEYLDPCPEVQKKNYAFKCHRLKENNIEQIYSVNAISFQNIHNTVATAGSDGFVNIQDPFNKKRSCQFHQYPSSIASLAFSNDGNPFAIALSYMYEWMSLNILKMVSLFAK
ncbi:mitotic checkpoint protein BUB3-like [Monodelphis domestica]|uniref:mitotic checkpoint protein BUB3-like n=1 Tax=Monodelphis domestica TaxID=13616 RepID=UPI0024E261C2|nr:mitotic checkpoint protein BUB3-like [Monodelphis domestica]